MVLYKHGVGYIERMGKISDQKEIKMSFKKEYMNDLLKSLLVFSTGSGLVTGVSYETPEDISKIIEEKAIRVPEREAMLGLFRQLKGYEVEVITNTDKVKGKILGTQEPLPAQNQQFNLDLGKEMEHPTVVLKDGGGNIKNIMVEKIVSYTILDPEATEDLDFFLEAVTSERKKNVKAVTTFLDGKDTSLSVSYIMQMPSWRVSYRLVHEKGKAMIQGWGIIDNQLDEDLKDVELSLMAGKPISFIYDLYTPPEVHRPVIREEVRGVSAPVELESETEEYEEQEFAAEQSEMRYEKMAMADMAMPCASAPAPPMGAMKAKRSMASGGAGRGISASEMAASTRVGVSARSAMWPDIP